MNNGRQHSDIDGKMELKVAAELARVKQQVSDLQRQLKEAESLANLGLWQWHIAEDIVVWSENAYKIFEVEPGSPVTYQKVLERIHPDDREKHNQRTQEWLKNAGGAPYEYRLRIDERIKYLKAYGKVEQDHDGKPVRFFGAIQDITEQVTLQNKLEASLTHVINDFIPICAWCQAIKDEQQGWLSIEEYLHSKNAGASLSHGICPSCMQKAEADFEANMEKLHNIKQMK